jgi:two-component system, NarL family, sensor histidine kinase UhpB
MARGQRADQSRRCGRSQRQHIKAALDQCGGGTVISAQIASTVGSRTPPAPRQHMLRGLWHGRSIRLQLLVVFIAVDLFAVLLSGTVTIVRARTQTRIEIAASVHLAELLVSDAAKIVSQQFTAEEFLRALPSQFRSIRHVRIAVKDAAGVPVASALTLGAHPPAPSWFAALVAPSIEPHGVPVIVAGRPVGQVEILGEPADEIAEIWQNLIALGSVAALLNLTVIGILYILFGRVLDPLTVLARGLSDLQRQSYGVRLPQPYSRELAAIVTQFNELARALEIARAENLSLNRQLIRAQDDERRRTALELHDEVGPCLFGLKVCASSIATAATELPENVANTMSERAREIVAMVEHLQVINRTMLARLRPMALGHVPLKEILEQLVSERAHQIPEISFRLCTAGLAASYGDSVDLTIYRCIQESLTNAIRHAQPKHVDIEIHDDRVEKVLELIVRDDGRGMSVDASAGLGITGMQERVEGLGGRYYLQSQAGLGTCVNITVPLGNSETAYRSGSEIIVRAT